LFLFTDIYGILKFSGSKTNPIKVSFYTVFNLLDGWLEFWVLLLENELTCLFLEPLSFLIDCVLLSFSSLSFKWLSSWLSLSLKDKVSLSDCLSASSSIISLDSLVWFLCMTKFSYFSLKICIDSSSSSQVKFSKTLLFMHSR